MVRVFEILEMSKQIVLKLNNKAEINYMKNLLWKSMETTKSNKKYDFFESKYDEILKAEQSDPQG